MSGLIKEFRVDREFTIERMVDLENKLLGFAKDGRRSLPATLIASATLAPL